MMMRKGLHKGNTALIYSQPTTVLGNQVIINEYWKQVIIREVILMMAGKYGNHSWPSAVFNEA